LSEGNEKNMTNLDSVLQFLKQNESQWCDDCLCVKIGIKSRQQIFQICERLAKDDLIIRKKRQCSECGKDKKTSLINPKISPIKPEKIKIIIPQEDWFTTKLQKLLLRYPDLSELKNLEELMSIDPQSAIVKIRIAAEEICRRIRKKQNLTFENKSFNDLCFLIADNKLLSKKAINYLHNIRKMGAACAHPNDDKLIKTDVVIMVLSLFAIVEECIDEDLI